MKIIVISDTHVPVRQLSIPDEVIKEIKNSDLVIHAGDMVSINFYNYLKSMKEIKAVRGNMDINTDLPEKLTFEAGGIKIGLTHGWGDPFTLPDKIDRFFEDQNLNLIVFGHSHLPFLQRKGKRVLLNPGACIGSEATFAVIEEGKIIIRTLKGETIKQEVL